MISFGYDRSHPFLWSSILVEQDLRGGFFPKYCRDFSASLPYIGLKSTQKSHDQATHPVSLNFLLLLRHHIHWFSVSIHMIDTWRRRRAHGHGNNHIHPGIHRNVSVMVVLVSRQSSRSTGNDLFKWGLWHGPHDCRTVDSIPIIIEEPSRGTWRLPREQWQSPCNSSNRLKELPIFKFTALCPLNTEG
jgi:hypothetical protein